MALVTYKFPGSALAAIIPEGLTNCDTTPGDEFMDLVVDGAVLVIEPLSPAAVYAGGGDGFAVALGEGLLDGLVDAVPVLFDVVLGRFRGIGEDGIDEHVDAALELGNAVGWWLVLPCLPDFLGNPVGLVRELAVAVFEDAGGGGGGEDTGEFHFFYFLVFLSKH